MFGSTSNRHMSTARGESNPGISHLQGTSAGGFDRDWEGCRPTEFNVRNSVKGSSVGRRDPRQARGKVVKKNQEKGEWAVKG